MAEEYAQHSFTQRCCGPAVDLASIRRCRCGRLSAQLINLDQDCAARPIQYAIQIEAGAQSKARCSSDLTGAGVPLLGSVTRVISTCRATDMEGICPCACRQRYWPRACHVSSVNSSNRVKYLVQRGLAKTTRRFPSD